VFIKIAKKLNLTYNEVNIIVYYLIIPLTWTILADCIIKIPVTTPLLIAIWLMILIKEHKHFKSWCDEMFEASVRFLLWFQRIGWNYEVSSVIICVIIPIIIYILLILMI